MTVQKGDRLRRDYHRGGAGDSGYPAQMYGSAGYGGKYLLAVVGRRVYDLRSAGHDAASGRNRKTLTMTQKWPIRVARPTAKRFPAPGR